MNTLFVKVLQKNGRKKKTYVEVKKETHERNPDNTEFKLPVVIAVELILPVSSM